MPENNLIKLFVNDSGNQFQNKNIIENIIFKDIYDLISSNPPANFPWLHFSVKTEFNDFFENLLNPALINKTIITLAGSFSSGKSSFINCIIEKILLPEGINPKTAVPTYILKGETQNVFGINIFSNKFYITQNDLKNIAHGYEENSDYTKVNHLIKNLVLETTNFPFKNLAFLDTPGYSKSQVYDYENSDEAIAKFYYNSSDFIIWFLSAEVGTITEEDLNILSGINKKIPVLIIINKADKLTDKSILKVIEEVKNNLDSKTINYIDICTFSKRKPKDYDSKKIMDILYSLDVYKENFKLPFGNFFSELENHYNKIILSESKRLYRINNALTFTENTLSVNSLIILSDEIKENIMNLKSLINKLRFHRNQFYFELKNTASSFGVNIPDTFNEPTTFNTKDFIYTIEHYKKANGIDKNLEINKAIENFSKESDNISFVDTVTKKSFSINNFLQQHINYEPDKNSLGFGEMNYNNIVISLIKKNLERTE